MNEEKLSVKLKKFDEWYEKQVGDSEQRLAKLKEQYLARRTQVIKDFMEKSDQRK